MNSIVIYQHTYEFNDFFRLYRDKSDYTKSPHFFHDKFPVAFRLKIYPGGYGDEYKHVSMFIEIDFVKSNENGIRFENGWEIDLSVSFTVLHKNVKEKISSNYNLLFRFKNKKLSNSCDNWGFPKLINLKELGNYLFSDDDKLRIHTNIEIHSYKNLIDINNKIANITNIANSPIPEIEQNYKMADDKTSCPICLERFVSPKSLQCGHSFCESCINQMKKGNSVSCPFCRKVTPSSNIVPNYMLEQLLFA